MAEAAGVAHMTTVQLPTTLAAAERVEPFAFCGGVVGRSRLRT
jgi:hypothetical protein